LMFTWEWDHVNNMMRKKYINWIFCYPKKHISDT
jgi:hypothetical protein